jgi:hypothetical protein
VEIGGLGQVESDRHIDQVVDVRRMCGMAYWNSSAEKTTIVVTAEERRGCLLEYRAPAMIEGLLLLLWLLLLKSGIRTHFGERWEG